MKARPSRRAKLRDEFLRLTSEEDLEKFSSERNYEENADLENIFDDAYTFVLSASMTVLPTVINHPMEIIKELAIKRLKGAKL